MTQILTQEQRRVALHVQNELMRLLAIAHKEQFAFADEIKDAVDSAEVIINPPRYEHGGIAP